MWSQKGREGITNQSVVREKLLDFFNETNMSKYKFAKRSGLSTSTIYDIVQKEDYDVRESNIMKICKGMDVTPFELFQTDKKVLVINDLKEINVILEMRYLLEKYRERLIGYLRCLRDDMKKNNKSVTFCFKLLS